MPRFSIGTLSPFSGNRLARTFGETRFEAQAFIRKGQRAWTAIKATAEEQRTLWLEVGVALMFGKVKENRKPGQKFSDWVTEEFPGLKMRDASDAQVC